MPPLKGYEKANIPNMLATEEETEVKGLKILTTKKLLTRRPVLLSQIKAWNNSYKLKSEIRQILYFLHQHNKITRKLYNNLIKSL